MAHPNTPMSRDLKQRMWMGPCALTVGADCSFLLAWVIVSHPVLLWRPWHLVPCLLGVGVRTLVNACRIKREKQRELVNCQCPLSKRLHTTGGGGGSFSKNGNRLVPPLMVPCLLSTLFSPWPRSWMSSRACLLPAVTRKPGSLPGKHGAPEIGEV